MMRALFERFGGSVLARYLGASALALAADMAAFLLLLKLGTQPTPASASAYALGILVHWGLSSRAVFADGVARSGPARHVQKALFVGSALIGLALTMAVVGLGARLGLDPRLAKLVAVATSFVATWLLRNRIVFVPSPEIRGAA
jgi:putative flippase GtrA